MSGSMYARVKEDEEWDKDEIRGYAEYYKEHPMTRDDKRSGYI